ncbi:unnamed protein product [Camellia sinensis]
MKTFSFAVRDSLINVGPIKDFSYGLRINADPNAVGIAKQSNYELVCLDGGRLVRPRIHTRKNGALCVLQQSIRPEMMTQSAMYQFLVSFELDLQLHDRRRIFGQICPLEYQAFHSRKNYAARPLKNRWSNEELMLATRTGGVTHLRHDLKLYSAYLEVHTLEFIV